MQQYVDIYLLQSYSTCFGCHSTHHQEYLKLFPQSQFLILLMMGSVTPETCRVALQ